MATYQAKSADSLIFDLTQSDRLIGKLTYKSWFKFNASIEMTNNKYYQVEPKGFWGTTIELKENEQVLAKFAMNWNREVVIHTYAQDIEKGYILTHKGLFKESFVLVDKDGIELLIMKPNLEWFKMSSEYLITTVDDFELLQNKELLLMTSLQAANYYMSLTSSG